MSRFERNTRRDEERDSTPKSRSDEKEFNPNNYVKVNERIAEFRTKYPDGCIATDRSTDENGVSFKTTVHRSVEEAKSLAALGVSAATGHSYLPFDLADEKMEEYAETVSIGRALANLGLKVELAVASQEEMDQFARKTGKEPAKSKAEEVSESDDDEDSEEDDDESDEDSDDEDDAEDEEKSETKLKSSNRFSGRRSRFGSK